MMQNCIDAHQHFWNYDPVRDSWITDKMSVIKKDFLPKDLEPLLFENGFKGCVVVQADQSEKDNEFQLLNAEKYSFIKGIVSWVDLQANNIEDRLVHYKQFNKIKGFRHILQSEKKRDFMLQPSFLYGISLLSKYNYTYDILIYPDQLEYIKKMVKKLPNQKFVIDHLAKPDIKNKRINDWRKDISEIATYENVYCKISGMVTEADLYNWKKEDFYPFIDAVIKAFGTKRIMYGSDWPVCLLGGSYSEIKNIVADYFLSFSPDEQESFFSKNAIEFYNLNEL